MCCAGYRTCSAKWQPVGKKVAVVHGEADRNSVVTTYLLLVVTPPDSKSSP